MDERYDMVRAVRDKKYRYIRNYMPFRITMQHLVFLFKAPSAQAWEDAFKAGKTNAVQSRAFLEKPVEELYDTENDPWEIHNLADDPAYREVLERMREAETNWMREVRDVGLIPETDYAKLAGDRALYDYMRSDDCPFEALLEAAQLATSADNEDMEAYVRNLQNSNSAIRYWGIVGLLIHRDDAEPYIDAIRAATDDASAAVATLATETLYRLNRKDVALAAYERMLKDTANFTSTDRTFLLNSVDAVNARSPRLQKMVQEMYQKNMLPEAGLSNEYDTRIFRGLLKKWGVLADSK